MGKTEIILKYNLVLDPAEDTYKTGLCHDLSVNYCHNLRSLDQKWQTFTNLRMKYCRSILF